MKVNAVKLVQVTSSLIICSCLMTIYCGVFSDPILQSKLARLNVTKWINTKGWPPPVPNLGTNHVCIIAGGRLGNRLFQYASIFGIARSNNFTVVMTEDDELFRYFNLTSVKLVPGSYVCESFEKVMEIDACCTFDPGLMKLPRHKNYDIEEWLQSWRYFDGVVSEIREQFVFADEIRLTAEYIVNNFRDTSAGPATVVGIHVRLGDIMKDDFLIQQGYRIAPESYIHTAIDYFLNQYDNVVFIVCSDTISYAEKVVKNRRQHRPITAYFVSMSPVHDMAVLAASDHVIMTVGTFGWWAGFLSNGTVVYYKHPHTVNSPIWSATNYMDFYLPNWIALE